MYRDKSLVLIFRRTIRTATSYMDHCIMTITYLNVVPAKLLNFTDPKAGVSLIFSILTRTTLPHLSLPTANSPFGRKCILNVEFLLPLLVSPNGFLYVLADTKITCTTWLASTFNNSPARLNNVMLKTSTAVTIYF